MNVGCLGHRHEVLVKSLEGFRLSLRRSTLQEQRRTIYLFAPFMVSPLRPSLVISQRFEHVVLLAIALVVPLRYIKARFTGQAVAVVPAEMAGLNGKWDTFHCGMEDVVLGNVTCKPLCHCR